MKFLVADMRIMYQFFHDSGMISAAEELEKTQKLLGRKPRSFDEFVKEMTSEWITDAGARHPFFCARHGTQIEKGRRFPILRCQ